VNRICKLMLVGLKPILKFLAIIMRVLLAEKRS
jgi:hypothetical protein